MNVSGTSSPFRFSVELQSGIFGGDDSQLAKALNKHAAALLPLVSGPELHSSHNSPSHYHICGEMGVCGGRQGGQGCVCVCVCVCVRVHVLVRVCVVFT